MRNNVLADDLQYIVTHTAALWPSLQGQRIFVTGGTGFIGTWLLEALLWANQQLNLHLSVVVLTRDPVAFRAKAPHLAADAALTLHRGDVRQFEFPAGEFTHVIHGAASAALTCYQATPAAMLETIVTGTQHTLAFAAAANTQKMLFLSSGAVYGVQPPALSHMAETYRGGPDVMQPNATYAVAKCAAEHLCLLQTQQSNLAVKIARCFAFVGPHLPLDRHFAIGNFIQDGLLKNKIHVQGDGSPYRSYLYAADLVIWLLHILCEGDALQPYNVGSDDAVSIAEVAELVASQFTPAPDVVIRQQRDPSVPAARYVPATGLARMQFTLTQQIDLTTAIAKTIAWYRMTQTHTVIA